MKSPFFFLILALVLVPVTSASDQVQVINWNPDNTTCNGILEISNTSSPNTYTFILSNVTSGVEYRLYSMPSQILIDSAVANSDNATLVANNLADGTYWIVEMTTPSIEVTYWNPNNVSCNGILNIYNTSQFNNVSIELNNVTSGAVYKLYRLDLRQVYGSGSVVDGSAYINVTGLLPGEYRIAETGLERVHITSWTPTNDTIKGIIEIQNSTPVTRWNLTVLNASLGTLNWYNPITEETFSAVYVGLIDGVYWLVPVSNSFVLPIGAFVVASFVVASFALLWRKRR